MPRLERLNLRRLIEIEIEIENSNLQMEMRLIPEMSIILEMSIISELGLATLYTGSSYELPPHEQAQGHLPKIEVPQIPIHGNGFESIGITLERGRPKS